MKGTNIELLPHLPREGWAIIGAGVDTGVMFGLAVALAVYTPWPWVVLPALLGFLIVWKISVWVDIVEAV